MYVPLPLGVEHGACITRGVRGYPSADVERPSQGVATCAKRYVWEAPSFVMGPGGLIHESSEIAESLPVQRPTPSVQPHPHLRGLSTHFYLSALSAHGSDILYRTKGVLPRASITAIGIDPIPAKRVLIECSIVPRLHAHYCS